MIHRTVNGYPIYDDSSAAELLSPLNTSSFRRGMKPRDYDKLPFGTLAFAAPFSIPVIPRSEWKERIEEQERTGNHLENVCDQFQIPVKNQGSTNYCWINAPVHCLEIMRAYQGQGYVELSPASCGGPKTDFRNVGGLGTEGVEFLVEEGAVPVSLWPANAISRKYNTSAARQERKKYRVLEWWELQPRNYDQLITCLLLNMPVAIGLNWWRHEVTAIRAILDQGRVAVLINNSWGPQWGKNGRGVLTESKATPDDAVALRSVMAAF